jgi:hypothetical protein
VFKADFSQSNEVRQAPCVVRLKAVQDEERTAPFYTIAAMQNIARSIIPDLVPQTLQTGKLANE